jgi:hypothetical protein
MEKPEERTLPEQSSAQGKEVKLIKCVFCKYRKYNVNLSKILDL